MFLTAVALHQFRVIYFLRSPLTNFESSRSNGYLFLLVDKYIEDCEQNPDEMLFGAEAIIFEGVLDIFWNRRYLAIFLFLFLMYQTRESKDLFTNLSEQIAPKKKGNCLMIATVVATKI